MKKRIAALFTAAFTVLGLSIQHPAMAAAPQRYTPKSGGFTMTIPPGSTELYHTTTGVRFKVGEDFSHQCGSLYTAQFYFCSHETILRRTETGTFEIP